VPGGVRSSLTQSMVDHPTALQKVHTLGWNWHTLPFFAQAAAAGRLPSLTTLRLHAGGHTWPQHVNRLPPLRSLTMHAVSANESVTRIHQLSGAAFDRCARTSTSDSFRLPSSARVSVFEWLYSVRRFSGFTIAAGESHPGVHVAGIWIHSPA
jgi:hypothetical protein